MSFEHDSYHGHDWYEIHTPAFQGILEYQISDPHVIRWLYALFGRMLYDCDERDRWHLLPPFIQGMAGSGKSAICHVVKSFCNSYPTQDIPNNEIAELIPELCLVVFPRKLPRKVNIDLARQLHNELPRLLKKMNVAYRAACIHFAHRDIWHCLPRYFKYIQQNIRPTDSLHAFLDSDQVVVHDDVEGKERPYMPFTSFKIRYNEYAKSNNYTKRRFNKDFYESVFEERGLEVVRERKEDDDGQMRDADWLYGVTLVKEDWPFGATLVHMHQ